MKKVKMLVSMAGPDESWQPGDERTVEDAIADEWEQLQIATIVPGESAIVVKSLSEEEKMALDVTRLERTSLDGLKLHAKARFDKEIKGRKPSLIKQIVKLSQG